MALMNTYMYFPPSMRRIALDLQKGGGPVEVSSEILAELSTLAKKDAEKRGIDDISPHPEAPRGAGRKALRRRASSSKSKKRRTYRVI